MAERADELLRHDGHTRREAAAVVVRRIEAVEAGGGRRVVDGEHRRHEHARPETMGPHAVRELERAHHAPQRDRPLRHADGFARAALEEEIVAGPDRVHQLAALGNAVLQQGVGEIGNAVLDCVVEALELGVRFGRTLAQFRDMRGSALSAFLATVQNARKDILETLGLQKALLTTVSSLSIGTVRPLQPVSPWRALVAAWSRIAGRFDSRQV